MGRNSSSFFFTAVVLNGAGEGGVVEQLDQVAIFVAIAGAPLAFSQLHWGISTLTGDLFQALGGSPALLLFHAPEEWT